METFVRKRGDHQEQQEKSISLYAEEPTQALTHSRNLVINQAIHIPTTNCDRHTCMIWERRITCQIVNEANL